MQIQQIFLTRSDSSEIELLKQFVHSTHAIGIGLKILFHQGGKKGRRKKNTFISSTIFSIHFTLEELWNIYILTVIPFR